MGEKAASPAASEFIAGPVSPAAVEDLARLRALTQKGDVLIHSELRGSSMGPAIPDGVRIRIRSGHRQPCQVGQVIAFLAGSRIMVHRVAYEGRGEAARAFVITQGDGNWVCDPPVDRSTVIGQVEAFLAGADWQP